jgi:hypothetical protein
MPEKPTTDFTGKTPAQTASIMKAEANGVKQNAERRIWPQIEKARDNEDKATIAYWVEVINCLMEGSEDPPVGTTDPVVAAPPAKMELVT